MFSIPCDSKAFNVAIRSEVSIDEPYLVGVTAPFDWREAQRRVTESVGADGVFHP